MAVTNFAVFGVVKHNVCASAQSGGIQLYIANGVEPLTYDWTGPGGFKSTAKDLSGLIAGS